jgi:hypothetical protein
MSKTKERREKKQREREEKMLQQVREGKAVRIVYEERKKKQALPNRLNMMESIEDEQEEQQTLIENATKIYRRLLPNLLKKLARIKDPRRPGSIKHKHTVLLLYGILMFVYQVGSRREANRSMTRIQFENLQTIFPELETMPHADTLARLLEVIEVEEIQECMVELVNDLIRSKKFRNYLVRKNYLIAIDGTQKLFRDYKWEDNCLKRKVGGEEKVSQYYVYVLESVLVLDNGITLPFMSEFLKNEDYVEGVTKQDCERKSFERLARRIKQKFPRLKITLLVDGLYACGPVIKKCKEYGWGYMITLKEGALPEVWHEAIGLMKWNPENSLHVKWGNRKQVYTWANDIEYYYGKRGKHKVIVHVVNCYETWEENHSRSTGAIEEKETRYSWISSREINANNVFERCTRMGRYRWRIENNILTEKHQGYEYEHCYSYTWNAMEGYHYLMKIGRLVNALAANSELLVQKVMELGVRGFIAELRRSISSPALDRDRLEKVVLGKYRLKLVS